MERRRGSGWVSVATALLVALAGCTSAPSDAPEAARADTNAAKVPHVPGAFRTAPQTPATRTWALLINGGGSRERNYHSHLLHLRELVALLESSGVPARRIAIFASDGPDPTPDVAVRDPQPEQGYWLVEGLPIGNRLQTAIHYENSQIPGSKLRPATRVAIESWISRHARRFRAGDRVIVYVTDHGAKNARNLDDNAIVLWGESLSVSDLRSVLSVIPSDVRIVMLMSQCFSGSFAGAMYAHEIGGQIAGNVCGFFSSSADRPAYGCYAQTRDKEDVGHSFRFFDAIERYGNLDRAHERVLLTDRTPDVPNRTSDQYLERTLRTEASRRGVGMEKFADELLEQAWKDEIHYHDDFERIDLIGRSFGSFGPRSLADLEERAGNLPELGRKLRTYAQRWSSALADLRRENFSRFLAAAPHWQAYLEPDFLASLTEENTRQVGAWLLQDLVAYTHGDAETEKRLNALHTIASEAQSASYRMQVRIAASLRMRLLLLRIAGEVYLDHEGSNVERSGFESLATCEDTTLRPARSPAHEHRGLPTPFPPLVDEMELISNVLPGWLGIEFAPVDATASKALGLGPGAVRITNVFRGSPAERAGLHVWDIVLGPPGKHFVERNQIREWSMTSIVGEVRKLDILRDGRPLTLEVQIGASPL